MRLTQRALTKKQKETLDFIRSFIREHDHVPSYEEIAAGLGLRSVSTVHAHVENLRIKGYLTKTAHSGRSLEPATVPRRGAAAAEVPLAGSIAAGLPIEAIEDTDTLAIPVDMLGRNGTYVLKVKGDSMIDDHVMDGDYIIVDKRETAENGQMVVALIDGREATLKRYRRKGRKIVLEPANPAYKPVTYERSRVAVQGIVVGILRKYQA
jgi:repressor LexA